MGTLKLSVMDRMHQWRAAVWIKYIDIKLKVRQSKYKSKYDIDRIFILFRVYKNARM